MSSRARGGDPLNAKKIFSHSFFIVALCVFFGLGINAGLIKRYLKGEFRDGFFSEENYPSISRIFLAEAQDLFSDQKALFVDSRAAEAYKDGHVLGAVNVPYEKPNNIVLPDDLFSRREETLVIYCDGSECRSSIALARLLSDIGFSDLRVFFGGWDEWLKQGLPIEKEDGP